MASKWLRFNDVTPDNAKTYRIEVWSIRGAILGEIRWFGRWRQYAFYPANDCIFAADCMKDIQYEILDLMDARRAELKARKAG